MRSPATGNPKSKMFFLVRFDDGIHYVCRENRVSNVRGSRCTAKYTNSARYPASILARHSDQIILNGLRKKIEAEKTNKATADETEKFKVSKQRKLNKNDTNSVDLRNNSSSIDAPAISMEVTHDEKVVKKILPQSELDKPIDKIKIGLTNMPADPEPKQANQITKFVCSGEKSEDAGTTNGASYKLHVPRTTQKLSINPPIDKIDRIDQARKTDKNRSTDQNNVQKIGSSTNSAFAHPYNNGFDYLPSTDGSKIDDRDKNKENKNLTRTLKRNSNPSTSQEKPLTVVVPSKSSHQDSPTFTAPLSKKKSLGKKTFCMYCKTMQSKFVRHLENKHKNIDEVKKFAILTKGNYERIKIIDTIRKRGMFEFNTNNVANDDQLMLCRRPNANTSKIQRNYELCHNCKGLFSKNNLKKHVEKCYEFDEKNNETLTILGRRIAMGVHAEASDLLKKEILPGLPEDQIHGLIRHDRLIILYGNRLALEYICLKDKYDVIRSRLYLLGQFLKALRAIDNDVTDFTSIYRPRIYDSAVLAMQKIAGYDREKMSYKYSSTAATVGTLLKKVARVHIVDCLMKRNYEKRTETDDFVKLMMLNDDFPVDKNIALYSGRIGSKKRWSEEEKDAVRTIFRAYLETRTLPTLNTIKEARRNEPALYDREPAVIKAWISNQYKKEKRETDLNPAEWRFCFFE